MRQLLPGSLAFIVLTGLFLILPVYTPSAPEPEPVPASVEAVAIGSLAAPAPGVEIQEGPTFEVTGVAETTPTLTVTRSGVAEFSLVGVTWELDPGVNDTVVQVRVQDDAGTWGSWNQVGIEDAGQDADADSGAVPRSGTSPLWTGPSRGVQIELITRSGAQPTDVRLDLIDPGTSPADTALGTPDIQDVADAAAAMPPVFSRAQWGADERIRTWDPQYAGVLKAATIHHTADSNAYTYDQVPELMRSIYRYHAVSLGWGDIGYSVVVDKFGRLWEGRAGGLASTVIAAHAGGFNTGTFGVSMLGNYDITDTPPALIDSVAAIITWKLSLYGVDPRSTVTLTSSGGGTSKYAKGEKVTLPTVFAHRDVGATACPGRYAFSRMDQIRTLVAQEYVDITQIKKRYDADAALRDVLGTVTKNPWLTTDGVGAYAHYQNGSLYYSKASGVHMVRGPVRDFWDLTGTERGVLRYPTTDVASTAVGGGQFARFQGGSIYWSAGTGARAMLGPIEWLWRSTGAESGILGFPTHSVSNAADGQGQFAHFEGGSIYWSPETGARAMLGPIRDLWSSTGASGGPLGYPIQSVSTAPDGVGQYAHFQGGSIYWSPETGARAMLGPIRDLWRSTGAETGVLGYPTQSVSTAADGIGQYARFEKGSIYWSPATGARALMGPIEALWAGQGAEQGTLGYPTQSISTAADGVGLYAHFQGGSIYFTQATGARAVLGPVRSLWASTGSERGLLGYPTSDVAATADGAGQFARFQGGSIYSTATTGTRALLGEIDTLWQESGAEQGQLGYPIQSASTTADGKGQYAHFQHGSVYWTPATGAHALTGTVRDLWRSTGGERGLLGYPTQGVTPTLDGQGQYARFQGGSIYWTPTTGTRAMLGAVQTLWLSTGAERGPLGYPIQSVSVTPDGKGHYARFQNGAIYWTPATGARAMLGPINDLWVVTGSERGVLGYPTQSVSTTPDGRGQYARFQGGSIYWTSGTGAHVVRGAFLTAWTGAGGEGGRLGYPTSEAYPVNGGTWQDFEGGRIAQSTATGSTWVVYR